MTQGKESLGAELCAFIRDPAFPCVGAKSALARAQIRVVTGEDIRCPSDDRRILSALYDFLVSHEADKKMFTSFAAVFQGPCTLDEEAFERHLWARLNALHNLDTERFPWSPSVSCNPAAPDFGFSLGGHAFFIVGLHPGSSRTARRLAHPAIVFNLHEQFQDLRMRGQYHRIKDTIVDRDVKLDGSPNPMIAEHGTTSEARQYSGRAVEDDWQCPFVPSHD